MIKNYEEILAAAPIETIIGEYVNLEKRGVNLVGNCPFHDEKTGSFTVSPTKQIYKCFGCGEGGHNSANFLMKLKHITFPEALELLSAKNGVRVEYDSNVNRDEYIKKKQESREKRALQEETMQLAYKHMQDEFYSSLKEETELQLAGKKYTMASIRKWGMVVVKGNKSVLKLDKEKHATLKEIGILSTNSMGKTYPFFYNRLLFPIHDNQGKVEGITGRNLEDKEPKYLNSPDSEIYSKSESVFGLYLNGKAIQSRGFAYLAEGPSDVVILSQEGVENVVASCGTSITEQQIRMIGAYTNTINVLTDGDPAGQKSMLGAVDLIVKCQLQCNVIELPEKEDPASFAIKKGGDEFRAYVDNHTQDGIKWKVSKMLGKKPSEFMKTQAITYAANLISLIDSGTWRELHVKTVSSLIGVTMKQVNDEVENAFDDRLKNKNKLSSDQKNDKNTFGIYAHKNRYYNLNGYEVSNFILKPMFLVRNGEHSYRFFDMINFKNESVAINIPSDDMVGLTTFKKKTEKHGPYIFKGKDEDFIRLKEKIYNDMPKVYQLPYLGYLKSQGIYAWGNGITTETGEFLEVDEYGRVEYNGVSYFMSAFSKINTQEIIQDEDDSDYESQFIYKPSDLTFKNFVAEIQHLFGKNGLISLGYYFASLHRDVIMSRFSSFPLLNLFGPPGSGKSTLALILHSMFGKPINAVHCISATWASFFRRVAQTRNAICWYEEYSEKLDKERQEGLKGFYDGFGRGLAKKETSNKTESQQVRSAVMLSGQVLPTHDPALLERCITLFFDVIKASAADKRKLDRLVARAKKGELSSITAVIHSKREAILKDFDLLFDELKAMITSKVPSDTSTRVIMSYSTIFTFLASVFDQFDVYLDMEAILDEFASRIKEQNKINTGATELIEFWHMVEYLISKQELSSAFYAIEETQKINLGNDNYKSYSKPVKLLYLKLNNAHKEYLKAAKNQGAQRVLEINSIKYYLTIQKYFVGECPAKRINNGSPQRYWVFNLEEMPFIDLATVPVAAAPTETETAFTQKKAYDPQEGMKPQDPQKDLFSQD